MQKGLYKKSAAMGYRHKAASLGNSCASEPMLVNELILITLCNRKEGEKMQSLKEISREHYKDDSGNALEAFFNIWVYFA